MSSGNVIVRFFRALWRALNAVRRVLHLILLLAIFGVLALGLVGAPVLVPDSAALVLDPEGELVEQLAGDPIDRALGELQGDGVRQVLVADLVESLESAVTDERIKAVVLRLELLQANGLPKLQAITRAMRKVQDAGKKVIAIGDAYEQGQYYIAAHADAVYLNDLGMVYVDGFGYYRTFLKSALDKLQVDLNVFRVGEFKSFVEPFIRDDMSEEDKLASRQWLSAMWNVYQRDIVAARKLPPGSLDDYANNLNSYLQAARGSASQAALDRRLVDGLMNRHQFSEHMVGLVGASSEDEADYSSIDYRSYLAAIRQTKSPDFSEQNVGVIVASGQIVDGEAPPGEVGGDTLAAIIRQAAADDSIKAVVLRVDSPGGSMFASEVVFDELQALKDTGKPLVVSMGSLAASGGYYISMLADEIWAEESTITGSIGVGALLPTFNRGLNALGIHVDGIGTTRLSGQLRLDRPLGEDARQLLQQTVEDAYRIFVSKVATSREMEFAEADDVARGRVWIGSDAKELGLVDTLGDLPGAISAAAKLAGLEPDDYGVKDVEPELSVPQRLLQEYGARILHNLDGLGLQLPTRAPSPLSRLLSVGEHELKSLAALNDPRGLYYLCSCVMQ